MYTRKASCSEFGVRGSSQITYAVQSGLVGKNWKKNVSMNLNIFLWVGGQAFVKITSILQRRRYGFKSSGAFLVKP